MRFKSNCKIFGLRPEMILALNVIDFVYNEIMGQGVTITSAVDGVHRSVVHSVGCGIDLRTRYDNSIKQWSDDVKKRLVLQ